MSAASVLGRIGIDEERWTTDRLAALGRPERSLYDHILRGFAHGHVPSANDIARLDRSGDAVHSLVERDLVRLGARGEITVVYPFSAEPTRHSVRLRDGRAVWAMCAIDALGIPFLVHQAAEIEALEPEGARTVSVSIDPAADSPHWHPAGAVVVAASVGAGCTAGCACPHINFFASMEAAQRYLAQPQLEGTALTVPEATRAGQRLFGDLLERLAELEAR